MGIVSDSRRGGTALPSQTRELATVGGRAPLVRSLTRKRVRPKFRCSFVAFRNEPIWVSVFDPIQNASSGEFERRHIFRKQQQAKRQHPKTQDGKKAEQSSAD